MATKAKKAGPKSIVRSKGNSAPVERPVRKSMTKTELISKIADSTGSTRALCKTVLDAAVEVLAQAMARGERIAIPSLGTFNVRMRSSRKGRNPRTGELLQIPEKRVVTFRASSDLAKKLAESR